MYDFSLQLGARNFVTKIVINGGIKYEEEIEISRQS